jgi:hypothetical protein
MAQEQEGSSMTEREMRAALQSYCEELDAERTRLSSRSGWRKVLLPAALGAGLLAGACSDPEPIALPYLGPMPDGRWRDQRVDRALDRTRAPDAGIDQPRQRDLAARDGRKDTP